MMLLLPTTRLVSEFGVLKERRPDLWLVTHAAASLIEHVCKGDARVTSIFRTAEENTMANAKTPIHCEFRAVDISIRPKIDEAGYSLDRVNIVRDTLNALLDGSPNNVVCYVHDASSGMHFHVQTPIGHALEFRLTA